MPPDFSCARRRGSSSSPLLLTKDNNDSEGLTATVDTSTTTIAAAASTATKGASIPNLTTSLVKSIVGSGVFALPAGVAAMAASSSSVLSTMTSPTLIAPATILIVLAIGAMNAYFFGLVGRICAQTGAISYKQAWERTVDARRINSETMTMTTMAESTTTSPSSSKKSTGIWVALVVTLKTFLSCLSYSMILADSFAALAAAAGWHDVTRTVALVGITLTALLPLCLLPDLKALAPFSFLGLVGIGVAAVSMTVRWLDGTYVLPGGGTDGILQNTTMHWPGALVLACTLATAFVAHYNAPRFHAELDNPTSQRFDTVTGIAFLVSAIFYMFIALVGYWTFGTASSGFILNNYSSSDPLVSFSRLAVALSITLSYPLPFTGLRDGVLDILGMPLTASPVSSGQPDPKRAALSVGLLAIVTFIANKVTDLGLVLTVGGGTFSTAVSAVFPALMFAAAQQQEEENLALGQAVDTGIGRVAVKNKRSPGTTLALTLMAVSVAIGGTGTVIALKNSL